MKFHKDYSFDVTLSSSWIPTCPRLGFGRENGATLSQEPALMQRRDCCLRRRGKTQGAQAAVTLGDEPRAGPVSPRQGQECLQEKKGVIPPGTLGIELENKPSEQRPADLKPKAPKRSHVSEESPGSDVGLSVPKHFTCSSASGRRVCVLVISRAEAVTLTCLEVSPARCLAHRFAYR